jgi:hypothetical protein
VQCTICHRGIDLSADIGKLAFTPPSNGLKNLALAVREVMSEAKRCHIGARRESNLRPRQSHCDLHDTACFGTRFDIISSIVE